MTRRKKKQSFSKIAVAAVFVVSLGVLVYSCWLMWALRDASALAYLVPSVEVSLTAVLAFYLKKAEKENTKGGIVYDAAMKPESGEEVEHEN